MGLLPDPQRGPRRVYETAFLGAKGDRKIVTPVGNLTSFWDSDRIHSSEKPRPVLEHFFKMLVGLWCIYEMRSLVLQLKDRATRAHDEAALGVPAEVAAALCEGYRKAILP